MTEKQEAVVLANRVLDRPSADSDDDLAILARQFLRLRELVGRRVAYEQPLGPGLHHVTDVRLAEYLRDSAAASIIAEKGNR